jgi:urease accessory protein
MNQHHFCIRVAVLLVVLFGAPASAWAHIDQETLESFGPFLAGLAHPVLGPDHLLAMVSVGIVSAILAGRHFWLVPLIFVCAMSVGWLLGLLALPYLPFEFGIAFSVVALGLAGLFAKNLPPSAIYAAVAVFGSCHGYAHGHEMPATLDPIQFAIGMLVGTAALHVAGLLVGDLLSGPNGPSALLRLLNAGTAAAGLFFVSVAVFA